jgi:hypothetical protein
VAAKLFVPGRPRAQLPDATIASPPPEPGTWNAEPESSVSSRA